MHSANIMVLGADGVGKTTIIHRYLGSSFDADYSPTNGIKVFIDEGTLAGYDVFLTLSDVPYNKTVKVENADIVLIVFSLADQDSFISAKEFLETIEDVPVIMVGNKSDLPNKVSASELDSLDVPLITITTKRDYDIHLLFDMIGTELIRHRHNGKCFMCQFCWHCGDCKCCVTN